MAGFVEYIVKIRDLASGQVRQFASNTEGAFARVTSRMGRVGLSADQLNRRIDQLRATRSVSLDGSQIRRATEEIRELERRRDRLEGRRSGGLGFFGGGIIAAGLAAGVMLGGKMVTAGIDRSMAGQAFNVMAGDKQGGKLHKDLIGFASDTIYGNEVFGEAKTMLGFGIAAKNVMPSLKMLGDVAMGDAEHMKSLTLAFSQSAAAGKLMGQDLLQYVNAGFNPLQDMSQRTGRSMAQLRKDMEKGKISFNDVVGAFEHATGPMGRFYNGMKRMGETPAGKWIAFKGLLETTAGTIGTKLLPALGGIATFLTGLMNNEPVLYGIAGAIGAMTGAWILYTAWVERAAIWTAILEAAAMWPLAVVGVIGYAMGGLIKANDEYGKSSKSTFETVTGWADKLKYAFEDVIYVTQVMMLGVVSAFERIKNTIMAKGPKAAWQALTEDNKFDKQINQIRIEHTWKRANDLAGLDPDTGKKKEGVADWLKGKFDPSKIPGGGVPSGVEDTAKGIAGGGVRNLTINIAKQGIDNVTIQTTTLTEGVEQIKRQFIEMFNQVVNSGNAIVGTN